MLTRAFFSLASSWSSISEAFLFLDVGVDRPIACCLGGIIDLTTKILEEALLVLVRLWYGWLILIGSTGLTRSFDI